MFPSLPRALLYPQRANWKICLAAVGIEPTTFGMLAQCSAKWATRCYVLANFSANPVWVYMLSEYDQKHIYQNTWNQHTLSINDYKIILISKELEMSHAKPT